MSYLVLQIVLANYEIFIMYSLRHLITAENTAQKTNILLYSEIKTEPGQQLYWS